MPASFQAVVLALPVPGADPRDRLAGLSLATRAVLTRQKEGATLVLLVVANDAEGASVADEVRRDRRVRVAVEVVEAASREAGLREAADRIRGPFLLAMHDVVVDP